MRLINGLMLDGQVLIVKRTWKWEKRRKTALYFRASINIFWGSLSEWKLIKNYAHVRGRAAPTKVNVISCDNFAWVHVYICVCVRMYMRVSTCRFQTHALNEIKTCTCDVLQQLSAVRPTVGRITCTQYTI